MVEIKVTTYKDERLGFFADQRKLVQKRYDRLEKQIKPDEPYISERREFLSDLGRELSFYNDVVEMFENDVVPKSEVAKIFNEFEKILSDNFHADCQMGDCIEDYYDVDVYDDFLELKRKYEVK